MTKQDVQKSAGAESRADAIAAYLESQGTPGLLAASEAEGIAAIDPLTPVAQTMNVALERAERRLANYDPKGSPTLAIIREAIDAYEQVTGEK